MRGLRPVLRELRLAYFRWALREVHPLHEDVPYIVMRINQLLAERRQSLCPAKTTLVKEFV